MNTEFKAELEQTAKELVAPGKGILAADESMGTIKKRLDTINVESTEENRRNYRQIYFTTKGAGEFISGVILFDETIRQSSSDDTKFTDLLAQEGIMPGIKVDMGAVPMEGSENEKVTNGLDGLPERLKEYKELGARFAKWRAVITIDEGLPTQANLDANARDLASYARMCQDQGIVPIVEPEVLMDGNHTIDRCEEVTRQTLTTVFGALEKEGVLLSGMLLKPNMVISAKDCPEQADGSEIAKRSVELFKEVVPAEVPGIVFLSGGQSDAEATLNLNEMNKMYSDLPWELSFSYGRALQAPSLKAWVGKSENVEAAQQAFYKRAKLNSLARSGQYTSDMEND